jgi:hypothetical protein
MSNDPTNPYSTPAAVSMPKPEGEAAMRYMYSIQYIFENPNWMMNVLLATLCFLIPVVGPIVLLGYQFQIIESLLLRRSATYPDFDFNKFTDLLMRGLWPFLTAMIAQLVLTPLMMILYFGSFMCFGLIGAAISESNEALGGVCMLLGFVFFFVAIMLLSVLIGLVMMPMMLGAGLTQELGPAFNFTFIKDFIARVWKEMILSSLFITAAAMILAPIGLLVFCVGMYAAMAVLMLANGHILYQLYNLYLARGGMALPMKPAK